MFRCSCFARHLHSLLACFGTITFAACLLSLVPKCWHFYLGLLAWFYSGWFLPLTFGPIGLQHLGQAFCLFILLLFGACWIWEGNLHSILQPPQLGLRVLVQTLGLIWFSILSISGIGYGLLTYLFLCWVLVFVPTLSLATVVLPTTGPGAEAKAVCL